MIPSIVVSLLLTFCRLREKLNLEEPYEDMCTPLATDVVYPEETIQKAAAKALHKTLSHHPEYITATIAELKEKYNEKLYVSHKNKLKPLSQEF